MDVHRCRFVPYQPSAINAVAFSHPRTDSTRQTAVARLAVGRANGDIEIWNPSGGIWLQELVIRGGKDRSIDGLVWVNEPDQDLGNGHIVLGRSRLFTIGYTSSVTEWDLEKGKPKRHASGQHGDIWCIAAQLPADKTQPATGGAAREAQGSNKLVVGTIDGELAVYSIEDNDLRFQRIIVKSPTNKAQMVSITFQSRKTVIVGCSDSSIRAYDIGRGHMLRKMALGADLVGGSKDIIAWSVKCLPNGNIVSGDSTGQICVWDGKTYTQSQRIQSHKSDVLSLATSADGSAIISGGMDRRTILYKQNAGSGQRWAKVWGRRYHDHDVKAMASFEHGRLSTVVSGGPDANLNIIPLKEMGRENHRLMSSLPQQPPITSASQARFILSWWEREIRVWVLRKPVSDLHTSANKFDDISQNRKLLKTILIKGDSNISSATIDHEGKLLFVSTATDVKAFRLEHQNPIKASDVKVFSVELPARVSRLGATHVKLSTDGCWLCVIQEGSQVLMARIRSANGESTLNSANLQRLSRLRRYIPNHIKNGGLGSYSRNITHIAFSADSKMVAVADLAGYVDTWMLHGHDKTLQNGKGLTAKDDAASSTSESDASSADDDDPTTFMPIRWVRNPNAKLLPKLPSSPVVLSFSGHVPGGDSCRTDDAPDDYVLGAITSSWNVLAFHPRNGSLTPWSRRHPRQSLPSTIQDLLDVPRGAMWQGSRIWVYGVSFLLMLDMGQDFSPHSSEANASTTQVIHGTKRKRTGLNTGAGGRMQIGNTAPHQARKYGLGDELEDIDLAAKPQADDSNSDEDMPDAGLESSKPPPITNGDKAIIPSSKAAIDGPKKWWITYKYRPILGIVPLESSIPDLEVAVVERPAWDIEMAETYFAGEEWER